MAILTVPRKKFKIFRKRPKLSKFSGQTKHATTFTFTTNNIRSLRGIVAKKKTKIVYG